MSLIDVFCRQEIPEVLCEPDGRQRCPGPRPQAVLAGAFNPLHAGHLQLAEAATSLLQTPVDFEICVCNVDKPSLAAQEIDFRLSQFAWRYPVWLTRAATFVDKAKLFPDAVFVVGVDTAERVLSPVYYEAGQPGQLNAMERIRQRGCRFLVASRRDHRGEIVRMNDLGIPREHQDLFEPIPDSVFRLDISSTQIRRQQSAKQQ